MTRRRWVHFVGRGFSRAIAADLKVRAAYFILVPIIVAAGVSVLGQVPATPQSQPVFRAATDLVTIDATVTVSGTPVGALRASDFVLTDNGVRQELEVVALETVPATITIIIDIGDFMSDTISSIVGDIGRIVAMVRPGDNVRLMAIDTYVHDLVPLRSSDAWPQINRLTTNGLASAHDGLAAAMLRHHDPDRQHIIIALTNGVDTGSVLDIEAVTDIARRSNAPLHIVTADLFLEGAGPPKSYTTRRERLRGSTCVPAGLCSSPIRRFWLPYHDREFNALEVAAGLTGGKWHMPDIFVNRNASIIFKKFYDDHRRSYRLRYVPRGVAREGWHEVNVTTPGHPSYRVSARPGYAVEPAVRPAAPGRSMSLATTGTLAGMTAGYDQEDYSAVSLGIRSHPDLADLMEKFQSGGNPWPDRPEREAAFVLELARAGLLSRRREDREAVGKLFEWYQPLLRGPLGPDVFEKYWLWAAVALLEGGDDLLLADAVITNALRRFPDEPRMLLARAFLLDRRRPNAGAAATRTIQLPPRSGISATPLAREDSQTTITRTTGMTAEHLREVSEAYDKAMAHPDTRAEARIRKAWLLHRANQQKEALALLDHEDSDSSEALLRYLRLMFQGRAHDALGSPQAAGAAYRAAQELAPQAQSPKVALMAHALERGDLVTADRLATEVQSARADVWDPWWSYWQGDSRLFPAALSRLRGQTR